MVSSVWVNTLLLFFSLHHPSRWPQRRSSSCGKYMSEAGGVNKAPDIWLENQEGSLRETKYQGDCGGNREELRTVVSP